MPGRDMPSSDYHADKALGNSDCSLFRRSRTQFLLEKIEGKFRQEEPSYQQLFGSAAHCITLEPEKFNEQFVVLEPRERAAPDDDRQQIRMEGTFGYNVACRVADAVRADKTASALLGLDDRPLIESSWFSKRDGFEVKCRPDVLHLDPANNPRIVDLKTTRSADPKSFSKSVAEYGYHRQAIWYRDIIAQETGLTLPFVFVVVQSSWPHTVACYELCLESEELAERQIESTLFELRRCFEIDDWSEPYQGQVNQISLPQWAYYEDVQAPVLEGFDD